MATHPVRWLYEELPTLVQGGVLDQAAADRLKKHYGAAPTSPWKTGAMVLIGTLGALLLGGGIILLFAHNWDMLSQATKAAISLALLVGGQMVAGFAVWKRSESAAWNEGAAVFLSAAVVTSISLISQAYHIAWEIETILLAWVLLTAPLVYAIRSRAAAMLVWVGATWWLYEGSWRMNGNELMLHGLYYLLLAGMVAPFMVHLIRRHSGEGRTLLLNWTATIALGLGAIRLGVEAGGTWRMILAGLFGLYYIFGVRSGYGTNRTDGNPAGAWWRNPFVTVGALGLGVMLFLFSFRDLWDLRDDFGQPEIESLIAAFFISIAMCSVAIVYGVRQLKEHHHHRASLMLVPALPLASIALQRFEYHASIMAILANIAVLVIGLTVCIHGFRHNRLGTVNGGLILLIAVFLARFFDFDLTFLARGVAFIAVGAGFLALNGLLYHRARKEGAS